MAWGGRVNKGWLDTKKTATVGGHAHSQVSGGGAGGLEPQQPDLRRRGRQQGEGSEFAVPSRRSDRLLALRVGWEALGRRSPADRHNVMCWNRRDAPPGTGVHEGRPCTDPLWQEGESPAHVPVPFTRCPAALQVYTRCVLVTGGGTAFSSRSSPFLSLFTWLGESSSFQA